MKRSFRFRLALRLTLTMLSGLIGIAALTFAVLRKSIDDQLNATLLNVASIQAASVTDAPSGAMRFHEWELTPEEAAQIRDLNRFAQVWTVEGESLLRTRYITRDLPLDRDALQRAARGELAWAEQRFDDMRVRSLYYPLSRFGPAHGPHVLQVAAPLEIRDRLLRRVAVLLGVLTLAAGGATFLGSWWLASRAVRPVHEITQQARAIEAGTLGRRISAYADSEEYDGLVQVLNSMLGRLHASFETQRRFAADASHELRSPLTALRGEIELARRRRREPEEYERVLDSALEEVERLSRVTDDLLLLARSDAQVLEPQLTNVDLHEVARDVVERLRHSAESRNIGVTVDAPAPIIARADRDLMQRLVWNLLTNAIKFTPAGGKVDVRLARADGQAVIEVLDEGPGIPAEDLGRIFDRFYQISQARTPATDSGTGLGLSIVHAIAELHGGTVTAGNRGNGGAVFRLTLPSGPA